MTRGWHTLCDPGHISTRSGCKSVRTMNAHQARAHVGEVHRRAGLVLGLHQSSHRFMARTITMSAARITNPTSTSNDVNVMIAHLAHVAERHRRARFVSLFTIP